LKNPASILQATTIDIINQIGLENVFVMQISLVALVKYEFLNTLDHISTWIALLSPLSKHEVGYTGYIYSLFTSKDINTSNIEVFQYKIL